MKNKGFTLMEIMVVIAILGILAAISVPKFGDMLTKIKINKTKTEMRVLQKALRQMISDRGNTTRCQRVYGYGSEQPGATTYRWYLELVEGYDAYTSSAPGDGSLVKLAGWNGPYITVPDAEKVPFPYTTWTDVSCFTDPWGRGYRYQDDTSDKTKNSRLISLGPDGVLYVNSGVAAAQEGKPTNPPGKDGFAIVYNNDNPANKNNFNIVLWME